MPSKKTYLGTISIALTYIGTIIGAGFASGREVYQFFYQFGDLGIIGIIISSFLFFFFGYSILILSKNIKPKSYAQVIKFLNGQTFGSIIDILITIFLLGTLSAMIAGAGSIVNQTFSIPNIWGSLGLTIVVLITVIYGLKGVVGVNKIVVPFLLIMIAFITVHSIVNGTTLNTTLVSSPNTTNLTPHFLLSCLNYVSYNLVLSIGMLAALGVKAKNKISMGFGSLIAGTLVGVCMLCIMVCISTLKNPDTTIPLLDVCKNISPIIQTLFTIAIILAVYTTAVSCLHGFIKRVSPKEKMNVPIMIISSGVALLISLLGFTNLVTYLYPVVGYGCATIIIGIIYAWITKTNRML